jgi:hypothetical protein
VGDRDVPLVTAANGTLMARGTIASCTVIARASTWQPACGNEHAVRSAGIRPPRSPVPSPVAVGDCFAWHPVGGGAATVWAVVLRPGCPRARSRA